MYAIEFQAEIKNGHIDVPEEIQPQISGPVRVLLLMEPDALQKTEKSDESVENYIQHLMENPISIPDFTPLTREEIYDRKD